MFFPRASERKVFQKEGGVNRSTYKRSSHIFSHLLTSDIFSHLTSSDIYSHLTSSHIFSHLLTSDIFSHLTSSHLSSLFFLLKAGGKATMGMCQLTQSDTLTYTIDIIVTYLSGHCEDVSVETMSISKLGCSSQPSNGLHKKVSNRFRAHI